MLPTVMESLHEKSFLSITFEEWMINCGDKTFSLESLQKIKKLCLTKGTILSIKDRIFVISFFSYYIPSSKKLVFEKKELYLQMLLDFLVYNMNPPNT